MATESLILKGGKDSKGRQQLYIKFSHKGIPQLILTPERINENELDPLYLEAGKFQLKLEVKFSAKINKRINKLYDLAEEIADDFRQRKPNSFSVADLKKECIKRAWWKEEIKTNESWKNSFLAWMEFRKTNESASKNTLITYNTACKIFEKFLINKNCNDIRLDQITPDLLNEFVKHELEAGNDPSYVSINFSTIRAVCHYYKHPTINKEFKPNRKLAYIKKQAHAFTPDEIKKLYAFEAEGEFQDTKDLLFRLITSGVRWSDRELNLLARQGDFLLNRGKKNSRLATIPLTNYLLEVLNKPMPKMSFWNFWKNAKLLCQKAGIDRPVIKEKAPNGKVQYEVVPLWSVVSSKIGRKSLISLLTAAGFDAAQMRQILGNNVEIEAYQVPNMEEISKKMQENMGGILGS
jgi:hypothetical protein